MSTNKSVVTPDGKSIAGIRIRKGWTQQELADRTGFEVRTIQKAEASNSIYESTLRGIAVALGIDVSPIRFSCLHVVKQFIAHCVGHEPRKPDHINLVVHPKCILSVSGNREQIPFAGDYTGQQGIEQFLKLLSLHFTLSLNPTYHATFTTNDQQLVIATIQRCFLGCRRASESQSIDCIMSFSFSEQQIKSISIMYDTLAVLRFIH